MMLTVYRYPFSVREWSTVHGKRQTVNGKR